MAAAFPSPTPASTEATQTHELDQRGSSLGVTAISEDKNWIEDLLICPHIDRLNVGSTPTPTNRIQVCDSAKLLPA